MKPSLWVSLDSRYIIVFEKVAAVRPEGTKGDIMVLLRGGRIVLDPANAKRFTEALLRFHTSDQSKLAHTKRNHDQRLQFC